MTRRMRWPLVTTLAAITLAGLLQPVAVLRVVTATGDVLACRPIADGDTVTLAFTHSMYGGEVREMWQVAGTALTRVGFETDNAAAAEYYATDGAVERTDDGFAVVVPPLETATLTVRVDQVGRYRLRLGGEERSLADRVEGSAAATMSVARVLALQRAIDRDAGCGG